MSVQVRRRREAASFLSTYVGAQGEILVDTTDNRVQVHDGATPGGWPAARVADLPGRNAVLNGTFAINQRAYAAGTSLAAGAYAHDRWKAGNGGCTYTFTQAVSDTMITITAGTLQQLVDAPDVYASTWWLTWTGTAQARVYQASAGAYSLGQTANIGGVTVNALEISGLTTGQLTAIEFATGTLGLVQFEAALPNAGPTRFERRHGELALCQRYYVQRSVAVSDLFWSIGSGGILALVVPFPVTMRATPTIIFTAATSGAFASGMPTLSSAGPDRCELRGDTTSGFTYLTSLTAAAEL